MEHISSSTAVTEIRDLALAASDKLNAAAGVASAIAPREFSLIDTEQFQLQRRRFRGKLQTGSLADFILYVKQRNEADARPAKIPGFIDDDKLSATVLFNLGSVSQPGHADDRATLQLKPGPAYAALLAAHGTTMAHLDALNWLQDWTDNVSYANEDGEELPTAAAYNALRKVTISALNESTSEERTHGATRSALAAVDARGSGQLPALVRFTCTPYAGLPDHVLWVRLNIRDGGGKPVFQLRVRNLEAEKEAIAQEFKSALLRDLEGDANLILGTFST